MPGEPRFQRVELKHAPAVPERGWPESWTVGLKWCVDDAKWGDFESFDHAPSAAETEAAYDRLLSKAMAHAERMSDA